MVHRRTVPASLLFVTLLSSSCATDGGDEAMQRVASTDRRGATVVAPGAPSTSATTAVVMAPTTSAPPATTTTPPPVSTTLNPVPLTPTPVPTTAAEPPPPTTAPPPPAPRVIAEQAWAPFASVGGITLVHPATRVERVGFHQSNHDGARQLDVLPTATAPVTLDPRNRLTPSRTAADVVVDPVAEIRSPVSGRVIRAGTYVLYCDYSDDYLVVEPDQHPGWEVKLLHIDGVRVGAGDRVVAGETVVAPRATQLPFESQVDEVGGFDPGWPHVHIEVIDLSIPDQPSPGGGCD